MKGIFVAILALALSACAPTLVRTYDGPEKKPTEIAVVKGVYGDFNIRLVDYATFKPGSKLEFGPFNKAHTGNPVEAHMLPGLYVIKAYCFSGYSYAYPKTPIQVKAGRSYELQCLYVDNDRSKVRVKMTREYSTPPAK